MPRITNIELLQQIETPALCIEAYTTMEQMGAVLGTSFKKIGNYLKESGELPTQTPFVIYPDYESLTEQNIHMIIGFSTAKPLAGKDDIKPAILPAQKVISCMFLGENEEMGVMYNEMNEWIKTNGYKATGTSWEYYHNGPENAECGYLTTVFMSLE